MQYRNLGKSNLKVSALCLGTMMFGDQTDQAAAADIMAHAHAHGVNFVDTADVYTRGASEEMLGRLIKPQRHDWVLATKLGNKMSERVNEQHYSRSWMLREVEESLRRLQTDFIDIYYLHRDFDGMDLEEPVRAMGDMVRAGKIRAWGVSNYAAWQVVEAQWTATHHNLSHFVACQDEYNLLKRGIKDTLQPAMQAYGLGLIPHTPLAAGLLSGKYQRNAPMPAR